MKRHNLPGWHFSLYMTKGVVVKIKKTIKPTMFLSIYLSIYLSFYLSTLVGADVFRVSSDISVFLE
jgi:hypothetical protein